MSNEIVMAGQFDRQQLDMIKDMYFKGASDLEFEAFMHVCKHTGLDPILKQIYPVKRWDSKLKKETLTVQTSIDGLRLIAERSGRYAPGREPSYQYDKNGELLSATAYVKKQTADGTWHEIAATAFYSEYVQMVRDKETGVSKPTQFWDKMRHNQLSKCAEALCLRKGWPAESSKIYIAEEMQQAEVEVIAKPTQAKQDAQSVLLPPSPLEELFIKVACVQSCQMSDLEAFLKDFAEQKETTEVAIIRSALSNDTQLEKFCKALTDWQSQDATPSPEAA